MKQESIAAKIVAEGELVLDAPLLIGSGGGAEGEDDKDIHVLRNKEGIPYIPGTSLAGVLRAFVEADDPEAGALILARRRIATAMQRLNCRVPSPSTMSSSAMLRPSCAMASALTE